MVGLRRQSMTVSQPRAVAGAAEFERLLGAIDMQARLAELGAWASTAALRYAHRIKP